MTTRAQTRARTGRGSAPKAVLWDMDGTLVDTEPYWIECEYALVAEFGDSWDDDRAHMLVGSDLRDAARLIQRHGGVRLEVDQIVNRLLDGVIERVRRRVPWRPGARELLAELAEAGIPCALVTMSWQRFADAVVSALPPGSFTAVVSGDQVTHGKPHPEPYLRGAAVLGLQPQECVAIEDSPTGLRSAVAAGCRTFAVPNVVEIPAGEGYTVVPSLDAIPRSALGLVPRRAAATATTTARHRSTRTGRTSARRWAFTVAGVAAVLGAGTAVALAVRSADPPPPYLDVPAAAWVPYWELDAAAASLRSHASSLQVVSPFWYTASGATDIGLSMNLVDADTTEVRAIAAERGLRVVPTVVDGTDEGVMASILADPVTRRQHVEALVALVAANGYDGLDIDYEGFAFDDDRSTWDRTRPNWVTFVGELSEALRSDGRSLVVTIPPVYDGERTADSGAWVYDPAAIAGDVEAIRVMAYDYSVAEPGPIAPLEWTRGILRALKRLVPDDTVIQLGVPVYGRNWVEGSTGTCPADAPGRVSPTQVEVQNLIEQYGVTPVFDPVTAESSFTYDRPTSDGTTSCTQHRRVHWVDAAGVRARIDLAREERVGGVIVWGLGFDTPDTWSSAVGAVTPNGVDGPREQP